jgi:hypothetical protein
LLNQEAMKLSTRQDLRNYSVIKLLPTLTPEGCWSGSSTSRRFHYKNQRWVVIACDFSRTGLVEDIAFRFEGDLNLQ